MTAPITSEARVPVIEDQEVDFDMLTNMGVFAQGSIDNLIAVFLGSGIGYSGCALSTAVNAQTNSATVVTIGPGFLKRAGKVYQLRDATSIDLASIIQAVPANKTAKVAILADGQEAPLPGQIAVLDENQRPADPNASWPTKTILGATAVVRSLIPTKVPGDPDVAPSLPAINPYFCLLGVAIVDNGSIVSVTQSADQQTTTLDTIAPLVISLSAAVGSLQSLTTGLLSSVAANALGLSALTGYVNAAIADLAKRINALELRATSAATATFRGQDFFQDLSQSNPAAPGYNAIVQSGLRFATALHNDNSFAPSLASNPELQTGAGSYLIPRYTEGNRISSPLTSGGGTIEPYALAPFTGQSAVRKFGRVRTRLSKSLQAGSSASVLANGDPSLLFAIDPSAFPYDTSNWGDWRTSSTAINHLAGYWQDVSAYGFWTPRTPGFLNNLRGFCQPFTPPTALMLSGVLLPHILSLTDPTVAQGGTGLRLIVCDDLNGRPDLNSIRADVEGIATADRSDVGFQIKFTFPYPIYFRGGKKYHLYCIQADGYQSSIYSTAYAAKGPNGATVDAALQNDYLVYQSGDWSAPNSGKCAVMQLIPASFPNFTTRIPLQSLQLQGGIDLIDLLAVAECPDGCSITYEAYVGASYVPLGPGNAAAILGLLPNNVPINIVFNGTGGLQPVVDATVGQSAMRAQRASGSLDHVSAVQLPGGTVTKIHKYVVVDQWNAAVQTLTAALRVGAGYATVVQPDSGPLDVVQADGSLVRSWTWTLGAPVNGFEMELTGTTSDTAQTFVGRQSQWDAAA